MSVLVVASTVFGCASVNMSKKKIYLRDIQAAMVATDIHDAIEKWHSMTPGNVCYGLELHEFLGLTRDEYARWFKTGELPENCPWY